MEHGSEADAAAGATGMARAWLAALVLDFYRFGGERHECPEDIVRWTRRDS
jgi:hypothetical protein